MYVCPLCNGLEKMEQKCPTCFEQLEDVGKVVDYYGDYSPYIEDEEVKLIDGVANSAKEHLCLHFFYCPQCKKKQQILVKEKEY